MSRCQKNVSLSESFQASCPYAPWFTQMTSCQNDAMSWRGAEIVAPHRQPWAGLAFKTTLPVPFPLTDGVICGWADKSLLYQQQVTGGHSSGVHIILHCTVSLRSLICDAGEHCPLSRDLDMILGSVSSRCVLPYFFHLVPCMKPEARSQAAFVVVGSRTAIPTEIASILGSRKANKRGFHTKMPKMEAAVHHTSPITYREEADPIIPFCGDNLTPIYSISVGQQLLRVTSYLD